MLNSHHFKVLKAGWGVSVEGPYSYLAKKSNGEPFEYFLNPSVYGGVSGEVYFNGTSRYVDGASIFDDRYNVGQSTRLVFGGNNAYTYVDPSGPIVNTDQYELIRLPKSGKVLPWMLVRAYDYRLASFEYFVVSLGLSYADLINLPYFEVDEEQDHNLFVSVVTSEPRLREFLFSLFSLALGAVHGSNVVIDATRQEFYFVNSKTPYEGEYALSYSYGELGKGAYLESLLNINVGNSNDYKFSAVRLPYPLEKPLSGMFTVVRRPEKLVELNKVVVNAIQDLLNLLTGASSANKELLKKVIERASAEKVNDWFRGVSYTIDLGGGKTTQAQVFLAFHGSPNNGLAVVRFGSNTYYAVPVILADVFDYEDDSYHKAYPDSKSYVTGPYGSIPIYDENGNIIGWFSDAYNK